MNPYEKVVVALDYPEGEQARRLVDTLGDRVSWFKLGPMIFTRSGPELIKFLHQKKKKIFLDLKLYDTPKVVADTVKQFGDLGVDFATVHCLGGKTMLEAASSACRGSRLKLLGVTLLTTQATPESTSWGWPQSELGMVLRLTELALDCRLAGVLCSPQELEAVREKTLPGFLLASAGIRFSDEEVFQDDQRRVATPSQAIAWGADYIIVGRPLTQAREPHRVLDRLFS